MFERHGVGAAGGVFAKNADSVDRVKAGLAIDGAHNVHGATHDDQLLWHLGTQAK